MFYFTLHLFHYFGSENDVVTGRTFGRYNRSDSKMFHNVLLVESSTFPPLPRPEIFDMLVIYSSIDNDCLIPS